MFAQNRFFTVEAQRTRRGTFLFGGEIPPNKKTAVLSGQGSRPMPPPRRDFDLNPEGLIFLIQSRFKRDWIRKSLPLRSPRLCGELGFENSFSRSKNPTIDDPVFRIDSGHQSDEGRVLGSWMIISLSQQTGCPPPAFVQRISVPQTSHRYRFPN
jgi:hypothetical protein